MRTRVLSFIAAIVLGVASLGALPLTRVFASGADLTCTWTGTNSDNFNNAGNWSGCNSASPQPSDDDNLIFDSTSLGANTTLTNNISNLVLSSITFQGSNSGSFNYTIAGNTMTVNGGGISTGTSIPTIDTSLTLGANQTFTGSGEINFGDGSNSPTLNVGTNSLTINTIFNNQFGSISGSGNVTIGDDGTAVLVSPSSGYSGAITVDGDPGLAGGVLQIGPSGVGTPSGITVDSGGSLDFCAFNGASFSPNISIGGVDSIYTYAECAGTFSGGGGGFAAYDSTQSINITGDLTLTADSTVSTEGTVTVSGPLSGGFTLGLDSGEVGKLIISSSNNTSNTPNGNIASALQITTISDNEPSTTVSVGDNQEYIVDGTVESVEVGSGGLLKGTGTILGALTVDSGGTVAPGHSPGCLTAGSLTEGGIYQVDLDGTTACSGYDQLVVTGTGTGTVNLTNGIIDPVIDSGFTPAGGNTFTIIKNNGSGPVTGTLSYNGENLAEGSTFTVGKTVFKISYKGGDGNDVVLTVIAAGTPDTGFALLAAHPAATLGLTGVSALTLLLLASRYRKLLTGRR